MYLELRCKNCNKIFSISLDEEEFSLSKCPSCGSYFQNQHLSHLAEVYYSFQKNASDNVELLAIANGSKDIVFKNDIDSLNSLYNTSSDAVRQRMTSLFDLFFLLMFHNTKDSNFVELDKTIKEVRKVYNRKCGHPEDFLIDGEN